MGEKEFNSKDIEVVYSEPKTIEPEGTQGNVSTNPVIQESRPSEGFLLKKPSSKVTKDEVKMLRYLYKIPQSVEVQAPEAYERIDWVVPDWVALYELMFKDGMRLLIPKLITMRSLQAN